MSTKMHKLSWSLQRQTLAVWFMISSIHVQLQISQNMPDRFSDQIWGIILGSVVREMLLFFLFFFLFICFENIVQLQNINKLFETINKQLPLKYAGVRSHKLGPQHSVIFSSLIPQHRLLINFSLALIYKTVFSV